MYGVCVLMSTYNGEKYIDEQIKSIFAQEGVNVTLVIRDDGSTDGTMKKIEDSPFKEHIVVIKGENIGWRKSFFELLKYSFKRNEDYYCFSDQDDYWMPKKIITCIKSIPNENVGALVVCNMQICNDNLQELKVMYTDDEIERLTRRMKRDWYCNVHGCTMLWNKSFEKILSTFVPSFEISHDIWTNTIANACGELFFVKEPLIKYRVHGNNECGYDNSFFKRFKKAFRIYFKKSLITSDVVAKTILNEFSSVIKKENDGYQTLVTIANYRNNFKAKRKLMKTKMIKDMPFFTRSFRRLTILLGKY